MKVVDRFIVRATVTFEVNVSDDGAPVDLEVKRQIAELFVAGWIDSHKGEGDLPNRDKSVRTVRIIGREIGSPEHLP